MRLRFVLLQQELNKKEGKRICLFYPFPRVGAAVPRITRKSRERKWDMLLCLCSFVVSLFYSVRPKGRKKGERE